MPKVMTAGARPGRLRAGPPDEREGDATRSRKIRGPASDADASASATAEQRITPSERLGSSNAGTAHERGLSQNSVAISPEPVNPESGRQRNAFQTGSRELARFLRQNGEAFAQAQGAAEGDAAGFAQAWMEDYDRRAGEVFNRIPSEVRALFGSDFEALRAESFAEADSFERDRRILAIQQGIGGTRDDYVELVGQEPARLDYAFQKMEEMIRASGLRPDLIEEEVLAARRAIFTSYRQARLTGPNPEALLHEMEAGRFEGIVPPDEMEALVAQTAAEVGQRQRAALMERQVDIDTRVRREVEAAFSNEDDILGEIGREPLGEDEVLDAFPDAQGQVLVKRLRQARAAKAAWKEVATAQASELDDMVAAIRESEGEDSDAFRGFMQAVAERDRRRLDDPVGLVLESSDSCREAALAAEQATGFSEQVLLNEHAIDLCLKAQKDLKGTSEGSRVLSNETVTATLAELEALPMLQRVDRLWNFMSRRGRHADRALDELMQAGLSDQLGVAAHLWNSGKSLDARVLRDALAKSERDHERNMRGTTFDDINQQITSLTADLYAIFESNGQRREGDARLEAARWIAWELFQSGQGSVETVVGRALAAVFPFQRLSDDDQVLLLVGPDNGVRSGLEAKKVNFVLDKIRRRIRAEDIDVTKAGLSNDMPFPLDDEQLAEQYADNVRGFGYWRNTCDGVQLLDEGGRPVVRKDGSFVTITWEEIQRADVGIAAPAIHEFAEDVQSIGRGIDEGLLNIGNQIEGDFDSVVEFFSGEER